MALLCLDGVTFILGDVLTILLVVKVVLFLGRVGLILVWLWLALVGL